VEGPLLVSGEAGVRTMCSSACVSLATSILAIVPFELPNGSCMCAAIVAVSRSVAPATTQVPAASGSSVQGSWCCYSRVAATICSPGSQGKVEQTGARTDGLLRFGFPAFRSTEGLSKLAREVPGPERRGFLGTRHLHDTSERPQTRSCGAPAVSLGFEIGSVRVSCLVTHPRWSRADSLQAGALARGQALGPPPWEPQIRAWTVTRLGGWPRERRRQVVARYWALAK